MCITNAGYHPVTRPIRGPKPVLALEVRMAIAIRLPRRTWTAPRRRGAWDGGRRVTEEFFASGGGKGLDLGLDCVVQGLGSEVKQAAHQVSALLAAAAEQPLKKLSGAEPGEAFFQPG